MVICVLVHGRVVLVEGVMQDWCDLLFMVAVSKVQEVDSDEVASTVEEDAVERGVVQSEELLLLDLLCDLLTVDASLSGEVELLILLMEPPLHVGVVAEIEHRSDQLRLGIHEVLRIQVKRQVCFQFVTLALVGQLSRCLERLGSLTCELHV